MKIYGSYVALATPWTKDLANIDYGALKDLIEWQIASGTDGIVPAGTTGESATMTHKEHEQLIEKTVEIVDGRVRVLAGAGSNCTQESVSLACHAKAAGADSILVITPYYNRPTPEGLVRHFAAIASKCDLPIVLYNVPSRTGVNMLPDAIAKLSKECPTVCAVKEASGSLDQAGQIIHTTDMDVMSGDDSLTVPMMSIGGTGVISVIANIAPAQTHEMTAAALAGDYATARRLHHQLLPIMKSMFVETNPGPVKAALGMLGRCDASMRLPMVLPREASMTIIKESLKKAGLQ